MPIIIVTNDHGDKTLLKVKVMDDDNEFTQLVTNLLHDTFDDEFLTDLTND